MPENLTALEKLDSRKFALEMAIRCYQEQRLEDIVEAAKAFGEYLLEIVPEQRSDIENKV